MRLITFEQTAGEAPLGAEVDRQVIDLNRAAVALEGSRGTVNPEAQAGATLPADMLGFLQLGAEAQKAAEDVLKHVAKLGSSQARRELLSFPVDEVKLLPPVPR